MSLKFSIVWGVAGLALHFALAFLMGVRHERGQAAKRENATLIRELSNARAAAKEVHEIALTIQTEHIASVERLNAIASDFENSRERHTQHFNRQRAALSRLLEHRPDLESPVGADVLRHWQTSNAGAGVDAADDSPTSGTGGIDAAVSPPADAGRDELGGVDCEPRCSHGAVSPVPDHAAAPDRGDEHVGTHGEAALLRGAQTRGPHGGGVP